MYCGLKCRINVSLLSCFFDITYVFLVYLCKKFYASNPLIQCCDLDRLPAILFNVDLDYLIIRFSDESLLILLRPSSLFFLCFATSASSVQAPKETKERRLLSNRSARKEPLRWMRKASITNMALAFNPAR